MRWSLTGSRAVVSCALLVLLLGCGARSGLSLEGVTTPSRGTAGAASGGTTQTSSIALHTGGTDSNSTGATGGIAGPTGGTSTSGATGIGGAATAPHPRAISVGSFYSCALFDDGGVYCWGSNEHGRLGNGSYDDSPRPVRVKGITSATAIDCGAQHGCALLGDSSVRCWGSNDFGQLGDGRTVDSSEPVRVSKLENVVTISSGYQHTCALLLDRTVWCWGAGDTGQLGSQRVTTIAEPVKVEGIGPVLAVAAGRAHTCAVMDGMGSVVCWGSNSTAQLGVATASAWSLPVATPLIGGLALAAGSQHTCAITLETSDVQSVRCWGWNYYGQLGTEPPTATMGMPSGLAMATSLSAADHSCAVLKSGAVSCWGFNRSGELGNGNTIDASTPQSVAGISSSTSVSAGPVHSCALLASGQVNCWGDNSSGELGDGSTRDSSVPVAVIGL
jgi:alpha-tubulin suppressor-like RCC1 family protein